MKNTFKKEQHKNMLVFKIAAIAALGGLLFGFDTGVISGAIPYFQKGFALDDSWVELITTSGLVGAVTGAVFIGRLSDIVGRKKVIIAAAIIFIIGAIWSGMAPDAPTLLVSRFFLGIAIGISSFAVPLYIAEISPAKIRGMHVTLFQLLITIGIMVSYLSDLAFALPEGAPGYNDCWRPMFYVGAAPALVMLIGMFFLPESPRWLISKGYDKECYDVLSKVESPEQIENVFSSLKEEFELEQINKVNWKDIFKPWLRTPLIIAVGIMFVQQFTGINTIIYYSPKIFLMAGSNGAQAAILASVSVGVVTVIFTFLSLFLIDKIGRRKLYFIGLSGMTVSLVAIGFCFLFNTAFGATSSKVQNFGRVEITTIQVSWQKDAHSGGLHLKDELLVISAANGSYSAITETGILRGHLTGSFELPQMPKSATHIYLFFNSQDHINYSDSICFEV